MVPVVSRGAVLLSMTGFGEAHLQGDGLTLTIEVRAVNNRHLKVSVRGSEPYPMLEPELEKTVRKHIRRGTVLIHIRCDRQVQPYDYRINAQALQSYLQQLQTILDKLGWGDRVAMLMGSLLQLPGIASDPGVMGRPPEKEWDAVEQTLDAALKNLDGMRREEGRAMAEELLMYRQSIMNELDKIRALVPSVAANYRTRIKERIGQLLAEHNVALNEDHLLREVALFADRSDVSEELMRLESHLQQFQDVVRQENDGPGRKLEFLTQEMFREANTIGSKAGDTTISRHTVEIKALIEKIREMVQNVE